MTGAARPLTSPPGFSLQAVVSGGAFAAAAATALAFTIILGARSTSYAVAGGLVVVAVIWLLSSERYALSLALLLVYVGTADGYLKLRFNSDAFLLIRDALLYAIVAGALMRVVVRRGRVRLPPMTAWVAAWVIIVLVELLNPANGTVAHSIQAVRPHLEFVPLFFFGYFIMRTTGRLRGFLVLLAFVAAINGLVNVIQFNLSPEQLASWGPGYANRINGVGVSARGFLDAGNVLRTRPFGLGSDIGFGGAVCLIAAAAAMALLYDRRGRALLPAIALMAAVSLGIVTSQARVVVVGSIISVIAFFIMTTSTRRWLGTLAAATVVVTVMFLVIGSLTGNANNTFDRYGSIAPNEVLRTTYEYRKDTLSLIGTYATSFPLGAGLGVVGPGGSPAGGNGRSLNGESEYTFLLIETGVPGLLVIAGFNLLLLRMIVRRIRRLKDRDTQILLAAIAAPLFALVISWVVGASTASTPGSPYMWFAAGILVYWLHENSDRVRAAAPDGS